MNSSTDFEIPNLAPEVYDDARAALHILEAAAAVDGLRRVALGEEA